ncbi:MAG: pyridoxal-phosphate-dependent aminotransferase family protein [Longimicrobiales bacterium]
MALESLQPGRFFLPGPTEVRPEILEAQARAMIAHRGASFQALMGELQEGLREVFRTARPVFVSPSSATGLMEAAVRNSGTGRVLALVNGAFSERFAAIAEACGRPVDRMAVPDGQVHDPSEVRATLGTCDYAAVTLVHSETSTGALNDVAAVAAVVREHSGALVLVDSVTGVGGAELHADAWGLDFVLTGSHKALALPPGLAFGVASERMLEVAARTPARGMYFDLIAHARNLEKLQTPTTPALSLLYALQAQLPRVRAEGMEARWARHARMAQRTWAWVEEAASRTGAALKVLAPEGRRSPTVTAVEVPQGMDPKAVVKEMARRGWVIGGGYGKVRDTTFRIGHMGDHTLAELEGLLEELSGAVGSCAPR